MNVEEKFIFLRSIIEDVTDEFDEEDILHLLLEKKISADLITEEEESTRADRVADKIASFAGSWGFILSFVSFLIIWMGANLLLVSRAFDAYPFILLNLILSCIAAIQAPLIMMSQNRQEQKDRIQSKNSYKINLKSEFIIEDLHKKMDHTLENQERLLLLLEEICYNFSNNENNTKE